MKIKFFAFALVLSIVTIMGTWGQNLPAAPGSTASSIWSSPQSTITEGRYRSNADDFIRPDSYLGVKFEKWFGLVSFLWDDTFSMITTAGFATKVGDIYIGTFYNGNMWTGIPANNYSEEQPLTTPNGGSAGKVYNVYSSPPSVNGTAINNVAVLIGLADMGFRLTYRTNYLSFHESDIVTGNQLYKDYKAERGYLAPQIAWAMAKDLTGNGIRPYVAVDLVFDRNYEKTNPAGPDAAGNAGERTIRSSNHFDPSLSAGLGGYTLYNQDGFKLSADLDYVLTFNFYDNEYSYLDGTTYKTGNIKGIFDPGSSPYLEKSLVSNLVTPSLSGSWGKDALGLKFKLNLPLTFISQEQNNMAVVGGNLVYDGTNKSTFSFIFRPDIRLALQYKLVPNKLTLNAGARIQATALTLETTDETRYTNGVKGSTRKIHNNSFINIGTGTQYVNRFHLGVNFNFTENAWVEAATGVSNAYGDGAIDVFGSGGLFSFGSILFVLKF
jgi:hypothetical protein